MLLAPGQWKIVDGIRVENTTDKIVRVFVNVCDDADVEMKLELARIGGGINGIQKGE